MRHLDLVRCVLLVSFSAVVVGCSGGTETVTGTGAPPTGSGSGSEDSPGAGGSRSDTGNKTSSPPDDRGGDSNGPPDPADPDDTAPDVDGVLPISLSSGGEVSADFILSQSKKIRRIAIGQTDLACPVMLGSETAPYVYVELRNNGSGRALTSVWTTSSSTGGLSNTANAVAIYPGATPPTSNALREQCVGKAVWSCSTSPCNGWPGFAASAGDAVEVPAKGSVIVFVQGEITKTGTFTLHVQSNFPQK
jgi:hypothetical protein